MNVPVSRSPSVADLSPAPLARAAVGSVLIGLPYVLWLFGNVEVEVMHWGWVSMGLGCLLLALTRLARATAIGATAAAGTRAVAATVAGVIALLQALPALLWVVFHGHPITDGSPPGGFVGHWSLSLPHVAVAALALASLYRLLRARRAPEATEFADLLEARRSGEPAE